MNFSDNKAIYLQIVDFIYEKIITVEWKEGEKVPSIRELAMHLEVNPNTVMRTYTFLQEKNIFHNQRGIGHFITRKGYDKALREKRDEFIKREVPHFIKNMKLLKISMDDFSGFYNC